MGSPEIQVIEGNDNFIGFRINLYDAAGNAFGVKRDGQTGTRFPIERDPETLSGYQGIVCEGLVRSKSRQPGGPFSVQCLFYQSKGLVKEINPPCSAVGNFVTGEEIFHIICNFRTAK
jgi:hypothetical protein